ncbi:DUF2955 domain-containing protein [Vibrio aphrogenes]|uniref:DUF2955 domain-containing protein n=1 Tax=Vibrio aphrogenes TaxID=1891186 RepID=UPI000B35E88B|nr:DUF2955 domain-containing protein [Vibrio aphrogenes]
MRLLRHQPLTANEYRQCLRIATGATLGFFICKFFGWQNGVFYTVTPILLLGLVPQVNRHVARQVLASAAVSAVEVGLIAGMFGDHPAIMTMMAFFMFLYRFIAMSKGSLFLFGATGVINLSIMLHFASYPATNIGILISDNVVSSCTSLMIATLMMYLWPDVEARPARPVVEKNANRMRHEALLGSVMATLSFVVFQTLDLQDSMSAQATSLLLLFPMHWNGMLGYARKRAIGTILGVSFGIMVQMILYDWSNMLVLVMPLLWIGLMMFSHAHVKEASGSGAGFGAMTTLGILFGQYLQPNDDLIFSALYRMSSIAVAIVITLMVCFCLHKLLNRFEATRFGA